MKNKNRLEIFEYKFMTHIFTEFLGIKLGNLKNLKILEVAKINVAKNLNVLFLWTIKFYFSFNKYLFSQFCQE